MLSIVRKKFGFPIHDIFFCASPGIATCSHPLSYFVQAAMPAEGFYPFKTSLINLSNDLGAIFSQLSSSTRYKIRRAEREGVIPTLNTTPSHQNLADFASFFDTFAQQKNLPKSNRNKLRALCDKDSLVFSQALDSASRTLVMHAYVADQSSGRLRLLYSASHFRGTSDTEDRNCIGRANRLLHWFEMQQAKALGFSRYDLGGIPIDQSDAAKNDIARFKAEFGGTHVVEYNGYLSSSKLIQKAVPSLRRLVS